MPGLVPARITERLVILVLGLGFTLVVGLLGAAGFVALRSTNAIESDAAQVGQEQLAMARLLNDLQAGQNTMAAILRQLAPGQERMDRDALIVDLEAADRSLAKVAASASRSPEAPRWEELGRAVAEFSHRVRVAIGRGAALDGTELGLLFTLHDRVVHLEQQLLESSERRMEAAEGRIESESRGLAANSRLLLGTSFLLALACAVLTIAFARSAIRTIESQASELSRVSWHMLQSQESLARRFSHELHDELGQSLAALKANLTAAPSADAAARRRDCVQLVDQSIANVRELSQLLRPVILDDFGLDAGLRWLTEGFAQRTGIATAYQSSFQARTSDDVETHLFRIAQEGLTNVARHSGASTVRLELSQIEGGRLRLVLEDNGRGLRDTQRHEAPRASLGMIGMRARATEIGGELKLSTPVPSGLRIEVNVPLPVGGRGDLASDAENARAASR